MRPRGAAQGHAYLCVFQCEVDSYTAVGTRSSRKEQSGAKSQPELHVHFAPAPHVPWPLQWLGHAAPTCSAIHACRTKAICNAAFSPALAMLPEVKTWPHGGGKDQHRYPPHTLKSKQSLRNIATISQCRVPPCRPAPGIVRDP